MNFIPEQAALETAAAIALAQLQASEPELAKQWTELYSEIYRIGFAAGAGYAYKDIRVMLSRLNERGAEDGAAATINSRP
jgi:hypothetical protein